MGSFDEISPLHAGGAAVLVVVLIQATRLLVQRCCSKQDMSLVIKWGREKLHVPFPALDTKLGALRATLAEHTALPPASFKLVHAGAIMKDDGAPLSAYGLRAGSTIALIGGSLGPAPAPAQKAKPTTEEGTIAVIREEVAQVHERLVPALDAFLATISSPPSPFSASAPSATTTAPAPYPAAAVLSPGTEAEAEHRRLGEELLQALLRLDVLALDGAWTTARSERKEAVKAVQHLLNRLDGGWKESMEPTMQSIQ